MSEQTLPNTGYEIACRGCRQSFDAAAASWCDCVSPDRTLVCPHCKRCFCDAQYAFRRDFWEGAPSELWSRKLAKHLVEYEPPELLDGDDDRPLVLVVDDDRDIRRMASDTADRMGCRVMVARDGPEGLERARRYLPQVVVTDALMPGLDGRELCLRLKKGEATASTRVIVMTSLYTKREQAAEARTRFLADEYLLKPIGHERFRMALSRQLLAARDAAPTAATAPEVRA
jgi:CheY-like chemotaxis protein